jgi:hypothetical protein
MRKSREVPLTLLAAIALTSIGCEEHRDCVNAQNRIVSDSNCSVGNSGTHYVYGGASGGHVGDAVGGGSVSRGGFGGIGGSGGSGGE